MKKSTLWKIASVLVFTAVFAITALAQVSFDKPATERKKNHRGSEKPKPRKGISKKR